MDLFGNNGVGESHALGEALHRGSETHIWVNLQKLAHSVDPANIKYQQLCLWKKGFTLIELLVVISVIAVLMAILMPALNAARDQGRRVSCMSNMRQVGVALVLYQNDYGRTPPKTQAVLDYASPAARDNVLKLLRPMVRAADPETATPVYACPSLKPNPNPVYAPTRISRSGYLANAVLLGRRTASIPTPGKLIVIQEGWSLSNHLWVQPEPVVRTKATLAGLEPTPYRDWHMFGSQSDHNSWFTQERREQTANVHNDGGNFIFADGHADYRKYWDRETKDYGLVHPKLKMSVPYEPTWENARMVLDAAF